MLDVALLLPPYGEPTVNISDPVWNTTEGLMLRRAAWNYFFVEYDHSHGMHNYQFTVALLQITRDVLKFGALSEGVISKIADVPNDQGKQVRVTWTRFGGDGVSDNPVGSYAIWRRIDDAGVSAGKNGAAVNTLNLSSTQISELGIGTRLQINAVEWDYVGSIPATGQDNYNTVVPTVFDSTIAGGMKWSVFMVSGHTQIPTIYAVTTADSGYSVDNLLPTTPANLAGQQTSGSVALTWNEPTDTDFNYFSVYRSVTPNFDPAGLEPIGKPAANAYVDSDVSGGTTYYYRLSAVDFSGNESGYSSEFNILVTSTGGGNPIPETYALHQNYPNPFNPGTTIKFDLKEGGNVVLTVYNMLGEEVMQLNPGFFDAGERSIAFNGENLTSGIYFYKIQVNNFSAVKKMILMK
jgi:fibronectin type 3 domain-containing protein